MKLNKKVLYSAVLAVLMVPGMAVLADRGDNGRGGDDDFRRFDFDRRGGDFRRFDFDDDRRFFNRGFNDFRFFDNDRRLFNDRFFVRDNPFFHAGFSPLRFGGLGFHNEFEFEHDD